MMNEQISGYLKSEKKPGNLHADLCAFIILHCWNILFFQDLPIRRKYVMWQRDICCMFGKIYKH